MYVCVCVCVETSSIQEKRLYIPASAIYLLFNLTMYVCVCVCVETSSIQEKRLYIPASAIYLLFNLTMYVCVCVCVETSSIQEKRLYIPASAIYLLFNLTMYVCVCVCVCVETSSIQEKRLYIPASAIRLCPQACPIPGRASYSHITATLTPPSCLVPYTALKAVGRENCLSTWKPLSSRNWVRSACACFSWNASSGWLHIDELSSFKAEALASIAEIACLFANADITI